MTNTQVPPQAQTFSRQTKKKVDLDQELKRLERELAQKIRQIQDRPFFAAKGEELKTEAVLRAEEMEKAYQEFRAQVRELLSQIAPEKILKPRARKN